MCFKGCETTLLTCISLLWDAVLTNTLYSGGKCWEHRRAVSYSRGGIWSLVHPELTWHSELDFCDFRHTESVHEMIAPAVLFLLQKGPYADY